MVGNRGWKGSTKNTLQSGGMLGAKWWSKGDVIGCLFQRTFNTKYGEGYEFTLVSPQSLKVFVDEFGTTTKTGPGDEKTLTRFALPSLNGFEMAVQDMMTEGFLGFQAFDKVTITCVDILPATESGYSDMPMFEITVDPR